jgi:hypothetical protein
MWDVDDFRPAGIAITTLDLRMFLPELAGTVL